MADISIEKPGTRHSEDKSAKNADNGKSKAARSPRSPRAPKKDNGGSPQNTDKQQEPSAQSTAPQESDTREAGDIFTQMLRIQGDAARQMMQVMVPGADQNEPFQNTFGQMGDAMMRMSSMWQDLPVPQVKGGAPMALFTDPAKWMGMMQGWMNAFTAFDPKAQHDLWEESFELWQQILSQYGLGQGGPEAMKLQPELPRADQRFADPAWREQPVFALIHQTYLLLADRISEAVNRLEGLDKSERDNLRFATRSVLDAMSPANFPLMNPVVLERTMETKGQNLVTGMARLAGDIERGQLTHTDTSKFKIGENVAATPGKVIHETPLYQLIQYSPAGEEVLETPLVIFPPWINRFYILDLNPKKSFVRWAVEQGLTVFMVSWRSADESLADTVWDDYIRAQMEAIDIVRERLGVPSIHTIGYCVAGTTLAATLALQAVRGESEKVASATFFTAQIDFEHAGDLKLFIDDEKLEMVRQASRGGYLDGRYMAACFNLLRGSDLIWNYVVNHYLLGEDYPAFDLLYWNGDVTNLPSKWHENYLRDLYRDNKLVEPGAMQADGTPIDLTKVETPCYVQAGREDHIAPAESVFQILKHFKGPIRFVLAGSGHIAGVVNPPAAGKYQYWLNEGETESLEKFAENAVEHAGSWWPDWWTWIEARSGKRVPATGARQPGSEGNPAIEDAPGRYVRMR